jgi:hypothetical protein
MAILLWTGHTQLKILHQKTWNFTGVRSAVRAALRSITSNMSLNVHSNAVIEPSSQLIIYGNLRIFSNITLTNRGRIEITRDIIGSSSTSVWNNSDNSVLVIGRTLLSTGQLNASSAGNTVEYNGQAKSEHQSSFISL